MTVFNQYSLRYNIIIIIIIIIMLTEPGNAGKMKNPSLAFYLHWSFTDLSIWLFAVNQWAIIHCSCLPVFFITYSPYRDVW